MYIVDAFPYQSAFADKTCVVVRVTDSVTVGQQVDIPLITGFWASRTVEHVEVLGEIESAGEGTCMGLCFSGLDPAQVRIGDTELVDSGTGNPTGINCCPVCGALLEDGFLMIPEESVLDLSWAPAGNDGTALENEARPVGITVKALRCSECRKLYAVFDELN